MKSKINSLTDTQFIQLINDSYNIADALYKLKYSVNGNSWAYNVIRKRMNLLNLTENDFKENTKKYTKPSIVTFDSLFCKNSKHNRKVIRYNILKFKLLEYKCQFCGLTKWRNKDISLELDHINGVPNDNRLENLRFLCPNCHSQTETYGARNIHKKVKTFSKSLRNQVQTEYLTIKNIDSVAKKFNISCQNIRQILIDANINIKNHFTKEVIQYNNEHKYLRTFNSLNECAQWIIDNNLVKTKRVKTCIATLHKNINKLWNDYYFEIKEN